MLLRISRHTRMQENNLSQRCLSQRSSSWINNYSAKRSIQSSGDKCFIVDAAHTPSLRNPPPEEDLPTAAATSDNRARNARIVRNKIHLDVRAQTISNQLPVGDPCSPQESLLNWAKYTKATELISRQLSLSWKSAGGAGLASDSVAYNRVPNRTSLRVPHFTGWNKKK